MELLFHLFVASCFRSARGHVDIHAGVTGDPVNVVYAGDPHASTTKCLDLLDGNSTNGNKLQLMDCNGQDSQKWLYVQWKDGSKFVYAGMPNKCVDVPGSNFTNGNGLWLWDCNGQDGQYWSYDPSMRTIYLAGSTDASKCMDLWGSKTTFGNKVDVWDCTGLSNQKWILTAPAERYPLVKTTWGTTGATAYSLYSPKHVDIGFLSIALAQTMFYIKSCPSGTVNYTVANYSRTVLNFDDEKEQLCKWDTFADKPIHEEGDLPMQHVARYAYANALIVEKTWGSEDYQGLGCDGVEQHYPGVSCVSWTMGKSYTRNIIVDRIKKDLDSGFPSLLKLRKNATSTGEDVGYHWFVVSGYQQDPQDTSKFQVHLNFGREGANDGWYDFDSPVASYSDVDYKLSWSIRYKANTNRILV